MVIYMKITKVYFLLSFLLLVGCDELKNIISPEPDKDKPSKTYVRQILDSSYLFEAQICSDMNLDYQCSESESIKYTSHTGQASIIDEDKPTIAKFIISKTVSSDPFHASVDNYELIGFPRGRYVSPFTTYSFLSKIPTSEIAVSLGLNFKALDGDYIGSSETSVFIQALARSFVLRFNPEGLSYYVDNPESIRFLGSELKLIAQELYTRQSKGEDLNLVVIK